MRSTRQFQLLELLVEHNISCLPVVEDDMTLVGILSEKDVVDLFYESENAENIFRRVPVTSNGNLVGIIGVKDVLNSVLQLRQEKVSSTN